MNRRERRAADQRAGAVEQHDFQRDRRGREHRAPRSATRPRATASPSASPPPGDARRPRAAVLARAMRVGELGGARRLRRRSGAAQPRSTSPRLECRSSTPCASLVILAKPPAMVTRGTGCARRYFSMPPTKSPMSISATSGSPCSRCTAASEVRAGRAGDMRRGPAARATSMPRWIEWIQAEQEYGTTMPVVPRIDSPPTMPSRAFSVRSASSSPPGIAISTSTSALAAGRDLGQRRADHLRAAPG